MTTMTQPSRRGALAEQVIRDIRVQMAIADVTAAELARAIGKDGAWVSRRLSLKSRRFDAVDLDDLELIGRGLGLAPTVVWAPRGSNPQPAD